MESLHGNQQPYFTQTCPREEELAVAELGGGSCFRATANSDGRAWLRDTLVVVSWSLAVP